MRLEDYNQTQYEPKNKTPLFALLGIAVLILLWYFWPARHAIFMDTNKLTPERVAELSPDKEYSFRMGQDFFVYYRKGWSTPKSIQIRIFKDDSAREEVNSYTRNFNKNAKSAQIYFDEFFFESSGKYEVEIRNESGDLLVTKKFNLN